MGYITRLRVELIPAGQLTNRQRLVMLAMATSCRDTERDGQPAGVYFRGWEYLARALDYPTYDATAHQAVARVVRELVDDKRIEPIGWNGKRAYRLLLPLG